MAHKVLIIDDSRMSREMLAMALEEQGINAQSAADSKVAMEILEREMFDLIVLDLIMPGLDGFAMLTILKGDPRTKRIPIVVLSGRDSKQEKEEAIKLGATSYLVKHITHPPEVVKAIKLILQ